MDLENLYVDYDRFYDMDFYRLNELTVKMNKDTLDFLNNNFKGLKNYLRLCERFMRIYKKMYAFSTINRYMDSSSLENKKRVLELSHMKGKYDKSIYVLSYVLNMFDCDSIIKNYRLKRFGKPLKAINQKVKDDCSIEELEKLLLKNKISFYSATRLDSLMNIKVFFDEKKTNLSLLRSLSHYPSRQMRKRAYQKEIMAYHDIEEICLKSFMEIKKESAKINRALGFQTNLEKAILDAGMVQKQHFLMNYSIMDKKEKLQMYLKIKAKALKVEKIPFYELLGNLVDKTYTIQEAKRIILDAFSSFDKRFGRFALEAFHEEWFDFYPRENKREGALAINIEPISESRIFLNYASSISDIVTIAHELGHAYHSYLLSVKSPFFWDIPTAVSETYSYLAEVIVIDYFLRNAKTKKEKIEAFDCKLQNQALLLLDLQVRYLFESSVLQSQMNQDCHGLCHLLMAKEKEIYGDSVDPLSFNPYLWISKSHFYNASNYYNFPYQMGLFLGMKIFEHIKKTHEPIAKIINNTLGFNTVEVAKYLNLDPLKINFFEDTISDISNDIKTFSNLVEGEEFE